ncbi:28449_t:CDS:1, partial [Gigaspora margarita]
IEFEDIKDELGREKKEEEEDFFPKQPEQSKGNKLQGTPRPTLTNDLFDKLKREIEKMQKENIINLINNKT